jgi:hypothetical protein
LDFLGRCTYKSPISNVMEIRSVGAVLIHEDRQVDMMKLKGAFCDYADASKNAILSPLNSMCCHSSSLLD